MARVEDDWLTRTWKAVRWALYAVLLIVSLWIVFMIFAMAAGS